MTKGFNDFTTDNNEFNVWQFMIKSALSKIKTAFLAKVIKTYKEQTMVDVLPIIKGIDADGNELNQTAIFRVPYFQYRGGINQITITPVIGDYGLCIASDRDITDFKLFAKESKPATVRMFDARDSLYIGGFLNKKEISNYIEINDEGIKVCTKGDLNIEVNKDIRVVGRSDLDIEITNNITEIAGGTITIISKNGEKQSSISLNSEQIHLQSSGQEILINPTMTKINAKKFELTADSVSITSRTTTNLKSINYSNNATTSIEFDTPVVNSHGTGLAHTFNVSGLESISGNLTVVTINGKPPTMVKNNDATATQGTLTTSVLDDFNTFISYLPEEGLRFRITLASSDLEIFIPKETIATLTDYSTLAEEIEKQFNGLATIVLTENIIGNKIYKITTVGYGDVDGNISYMEDIINNIGATSGVLTTGIFNNWNDFLNSLSSKSIAFRIIAGGNSIEYKLRYSDISSNTGFDTFAEYLNKISDEINVSYEFDEETQQYNLIFSTNRTGAARGRISYMKEIDTPDTPATLVSGELDNWNSFKNSIGSQNFGLRGNINGESVTFFITNDQLDECSSYYDFVSKCFTRTGITTKYELSNKITITTVLSGSKATLSYMESLDKIPATSSYLETGYLTNIEEIYKQYESLTANIVFYIEANGTRNDFSVSIEKLGQCKSYQDLCDIFKTQSENLVITYNSTTNTMRFTIDNTGPLDISYMKYDEPEPEPEPQTVEIDGSYLFSGTSSVATIFVGNDEVGNINQQSASLIKMTQDTGAILNNGETLDFAKDSINLMKGTQITGATITQGRDGTIVMINDSATLLKGTMEEGAILIKGSDTGIPDVYDGIAKISGKLLVSEEVESESLVINKNTNITGDIVLNPYNISEGGEIYEKSDVIVNGGIITETLTVSETANIGKLVVNDGVEIYGDISLNSSRILGNGNVLSFDSDGVRNNKNLISSDYVAE